MATTATPPSPEAQLLNKVLTGLYALQANPDAPEPVFFAIFMDISKLINSQTPSVKPELAQGMVQVRVGMDHFSKVYSNIANMFKAKAINEPDVAAKKEATDLATKAEEFSQIFSQLGKKIDSIVPQATPQNATNPAPSFFAPLNQHQASPQAPQPVVLRPSTRKRKNRPLLNEAKSYIISAANFSAKHAWAPAALVVGGTTYMTTENVNRFTMNITGSDPILFGVAAASLTAVALYGKRYTKAIAASITSTMITIGTGFLPVAGYHPHPSVHVVSTDAPTAGFHTGDTVEVVRKGATYIKIDNGKRVEDVLPRGTTMRVDVVGAGILTGNVQTLGIISVYPQDVKIASPDKAPGILGPKESDDTKPTPTTTQPPQNAPQSPSRNGVFPVVPNGRGLQPI